MSRSRRAAGLSILLIVLLCTPSVPLQSQVADSTEYAANSTGEDPPFAKNAGRYRLRVYPEFCMGVGLSVAGPDMEKFDPQYQESSQPSEYSPFGSVGLKLRYQPLAWLAFTLTTEARVDFNLQFDAEDRYNHWLRNAISVTGHQGFHAGGLFSVFGGAGITRIDYEHSGLTWNVDETLHITAREFGVHLIGGIELDMVGGPLLSLSAAYDIMPEVENVDLSSSVVGFHVLFQF